MRSINTLKRDGTSEEKKSLIEHFGKPGEKPLEARKAREAREPAKMLEDIREKVSSNNHSSLKTKHDDNNNINNIHNNLENDELNKELKKDSKNIISRKNMTVNYVTSVLVIVVFLISYQLFYYFMYRSFINQTIESNLITKMLYTNCFSIDYLSKKLDNLITQQTYLVKTKTDDKFDLLLNNSINEFLELTDEIYANKEMFMSNITTIMNGDVCTILNNLNSCNYTYNFTYIHKTGLKNLVSFYVETIREAYQFYIENDLTIHSVTELYTDYRYTSARFLIENIEVIYNEIFNQFFYVLSLYYTNLLIMLITLGIFLNIIYIALLLYKLNEFISNLINEEMLSNRLIGEIPLSIILANKALGNLLKEAIGMKVKE